MANSGPWLIVGLGNPGEKYARNRHNIGHQVVQYLAESNSGTFTHHKAGACAAQVRLGMLPGGRPGPAAIVAYLDSYMNVSGRPTAALMKFFKIPTDRLLVVHDELDLDEHVLRLKKNGGEGGHNGLKSISAAIGTRDYARLRVGIGRPPGRMNPADYVLSDFPQRDQVEWEITVREAADAITDVVSTDLPAAQQRLHTR
ncbi:aminoacyl-tRNA hydrolase [Gleimia hominis]|uniref:aminoacyl-tRNA hydrolase n=1 Tax=Gleimia hominis TaxID=595468 RepID=UPI000C7FB731|nr:aminoacyl-tRNA hydrolase [Gleimia hominis]WIK63735.1 aminoacyl-tRNA hydrolase [Gleimia hominis]